MFWIALFLICVSTSSARAGFFGMGDGVHNFAEKIGKAISHIIPKTVAKAVAPVKLVKKLTTTKLPHVKTQSNSKNQRTTKAPETQSIFELTKIMFS